jgi:o-aminophenol oxidase
VRPEIQDRNFDLDEQGRLTGRLVHKTDPEVMEAFPPFTVVNGKVWPVGDVEPATYRFRVLNGSNARTYRLVLVHEGEPALDRITQIGTDHGLLRTAVPMPADGLVLAPAERADLLVDFSDLAPGSELTVLNTAAAPFDGSSFPVADAENAADLDRLLPYPRVLRFRVAGEAASAIPIPRELATDYEPLTADGLAGARRRAIALVEHELDNEPNMLTMPELTLAAYTDDAPRVSIIDGGQTTGYRVVAARFEDTTTFFPMLGEYEVWQLINLTGDTHLIHLHLHPFQILARAGRSATSRCRRTSCSSWGDGRLTHQARVDVHDTRRLGLPECDLLRPTPSGCVTYPGFQRPPPRSRLRMHSTRAEGQEPRAPRGRRAARLARRL